MSTGKVKWFKPQKGYGFVVLADGRTEVFVHFTAIKKHAPRTLNAGDEVELDVEQGPKGLKARAVRLLRSTPNKRR